jgi:hypothetical protein
MWAMANILMNAVYETQIHARLKASRDQAVYLQIVKRRIIL